MTATAEDLLAFMDDETKQALFQMQRLASELRLRQPAIQRRMAYVRGDQPLAYASPEFSRYMGDRFAGFSDNWCLPITQTPAERMVVQGIRLDSDDLRPDPEMSRVWRTNNCERGAAEAFVVGLAAARAFALVWGDDEDPETPVITWERPEQAIVAYRPDTGKPIAGLKLWSDDDAGYEYATLYTRDRVWKWQRRGVALVVKHEPRPAVDPTGGWEPRQPDGDDTWPIGNPMGMVPLVEFRNQTLLDDSPMSDIDGVMAMQDTINLIWAYLVNALDYASLPQRIIIGAEVPRIPILNAEGQVVGERPVDLDQLVKDRILWVPGEDASATEWSAARLDVFSSVIERAIEHIAAQTRTPSHYLIGRIANLSADALTAAETGLVSKTRERLTYFTPSLRRVYALVAAAQGNPERARAAISGTLVWGDIQFRSLAQKVDALMKLHGMGFPLEWIAEQYGLEPPEVQRVMQMREREMLMDPVGAIAQTLERTRPPGPDSPEPSGVQEGVEAEDAVA